MKIPTPGKLKAEFHLAMARPVMISVVALAAALLAIMIAWSR